MESEFAFLRKELSDLRKVVRKTAEDSEEKGAFNSEWRSFLRDSRNLRLRFNQSILFVLQNNTDSSLDKPTVVGILGEPGLPPPIDPGRRGQFSFGKQE
ncbi:unnamed protein product [Allacma fusca]|uniref:Uncharacterized protein n=1 Tax=Allacma fusca TaxID=39272 RepID=A0A8J2PPN4_9HEXA|nr:unnamed protein product [Allacma fusca]